MKVSMLPRFRFSCRALAMMTVLSSGGAALLSVEHAGAQSIITHADTSIATVESVDPTTGEVLLREEGGELFTIDLPLKLHELPHVSPGDRLQIHAVKTLDATLAQPGTPSPESTLSTARGYANRHPHGTLVSFRRRRVRVVAVNVPAHLISVMDAAGHPREVLINRKIFFPLLESLKKGDEVDVTTMEAVSYTVLNRVVAPKVDVEQQAGAALPQPSANAPTQ